MHAYVFYLRTVFVHTFLAMFKRRRSQFIGVLMMLPAFMPFLLIWLPRSEDLGDSNLGVFTQMSEILYIMATTPLLALFFGAMLIGEDIESQTIPYVLTRPVPRSAWIVGRFGAYLTLCSLIIFAALCITFIGCAVLEPAFASFDSVLLLVRYQAVATMSLMGYGGLCVFLGAMVKRPVIVGVLIIFLWERLAFLAPGLTDFLTIEKYVNTLLPEGGQNILLEARGSVMDVYGGELAVSNTGAFLALVGMTAVFIALTTLAVIDREYTTPMAVTE